MRLIRSNIPHDEKNMKVTLAASKPRTFAIFGRYVEVPI
jgi:hypothetical protein